MYLYLYLYLCEPILNYRYRNRNRMNNYTKTPINTLSGDDVRLVYGEPLSVTLFLLLDLSLSRYLPDD